MYRQGSEVHYKMGKIEGDAIIVGKAPIGQSHLGETYILEDKSGNFPSSGYPYTHFVCSEMFLRETIITTGKIEGEPT